MNSLIQVISFFVSFMFGIIFFLLTVLNFKLIKDLKRYIQHILTFIYVLDMVIVYIIIFYHLNKGYFHIYFILMVFVGFFTGAIIHKKIISKIDVNNYFKRWKFFFVMLVSKWNRMGRHAKKN